MKKLCFVAASPMTLRFFMRNHLLRLSEQYSVTAIADFSPEDLDGQWLPGVRLVRIPIAREIDPLSDIRSLAALVHHFWCERYDSVHSVTPKAGLLSMLASKISGVPIRIHCFTGQVWATRSGMGRLLLKNADRLIAFCATHVLADSLSQRSFLETEGVLGHGKGEVLGRGSIAGVDLQRFRPDQSARERIRAELGVPLQAFLFLYVGRLNHDKGVLDLARAYARLAREKENVWLAIVGPDEANIGAEMSRHCAEAAARVVRVGYTAHPEGFMAAADAFVLPSYREGFGSVVIEAAACGVPAVASRIYGLTDAIVDGETGLLHPAGDVPALFAQLKRMHDDAAMRAEMGRKARARAHAEFSMDYVTSEMVAFYRTVLRSEGSMTEK
jgi:glycosyltransferase involved in cell wall biosynthesis